jgi:hypothetical protein
MCASITLLVRSFSRLLPVENGADLIFSMANRPRPDDRPSFLALNLNAYPIGNDDGSQKLLKGNASVFRLQTEKMKILLPYRHHQFRHIGTIPLRLAVLPHGDKFMSVEVGSEVAVLTPGSQLLIGIRRVVDVQFCSSATGTLLVRETIHPASILESSEPAEMHQIPARGSGD